MIEQRLYLEEFKVTGAHVGGDPDKYVGIRFTWVSTQTGFGWGNDNEVTGKFYVTAFGRATEEYTVKCSLPEDSTVTVTSYDLLLKRPTKADKNRDIWIDTWMDTEVNGVDVIEKSITWNDVAPLTALIWRVEDRSLGESCLVEYTRGYATPSLNNYWLKFTLGDFSHYVRPREGLPGTDAVSYTYSGYTLPYEIASQIPNDTSGIVTVTLLIKGTFNGNAYENVYDSMQFVVRVPNNEYTRPAVSMALSPLSSLPSPYSGMYLQGHSRVKAALTFDPKYGASVVESSIVVGNTSYGEPYESGLFTQSGKVKVKATVTDSRGFTGSTEQEIEVVPYTTPSIRSIAGQEDVICERCDAAGNYTDSGTYLKIAARAIYAKVVFGGTQYNYGKIKYRYRKESGTYSDWVTILDCETAGTDEITTAPLLNGKLDTEANYYVQILAADDLYETVPITFSISSDYVYMDRPAGGKSMGLGGYASGDGRLDVYWRFIARGGFSTLDQSGEEIPIDSSMPIPKGEISEGWSPDNLDAGVYVIGHDVGLSSGGTVIMQNGVLIQMNGIADGAVKAQIALPRDENASPKYRLCWFSAWDGWRDMKL